MGHGTISVGQGMFKLVQIHFTIKGKVKLYIILNEYPSTDFCDKVCKIYLTKTSSYASIFRDAFIIK